MRKIFTLMLFSLFLMNFSCAAEDLDTDKYFMYNGFRMYDDQITNKVSYSIKVEQQVEYDFEMSYYYDGELVDVCKKDILLKEDEGFTKVTCEVEKLGNGEYMFDAYLFLNGSEMRENVFNLEYVYGQGKANIDFEDRGDRTNIKITIDGEFDNVEVLNRIPKSVIEILNDDNKDLLIESEKEYKILEEDPLIAWNVEKTPDSINYTINKKISEEQMKEFQIEMTQTNSFKFLKYLMGLLILIIVILLIRPLFKENGSKK